MICRRARFLLLPLAVLAVVTAGCSGGCSREEGPATTGGPRLELLAGEVEILGDDGAWRAATAGELAEGAQVRTGAGAQARVVYADGRVLRLGQDTQVTLRSAGGRIRVELEAGELVAAPGRLAIQLLTPVGEADLSADGSGRISVRAGRLDVALDVGGLEIVDESGARSRTGADGRLLVALDGVEIEPAAKADPDPEPPPGVPTQALALRLRAVKGAPSYREKSGAAPRRIPKTFVEVPVGAQFRVPKGSAAAAGAGGLGLALNSGADGALIRADTDGVRESYGLVLRGGGAGVRLGSPGSTLEVEGAGAKGQLRAAQPASLAVTRKADGLWVEVEAGAIEVGEGEDARTLGAGERAKLGGKGPVEPVKVPPVVVLSAAETRVYGASAEPFALRAPEDTPPGARLELFEDGKFETLLAAGSAAAPLGFRARPRGDLFFRVVPAEGAAATHDGRIRFFTERTRRSRPDDAVAEVSETGLRATVYFQAGAPPLAFVGAERAEARGYRLQVFRADALTSPLVERKAPGPRFELERGRIGEGDYVWLVSPTDAAGRELAGGKMNRLEIVYDNSMTTLVLESPAMRQRVRGGQVAVKGIAPLGMKVEVNGRALPLDEKGRFARTVPVDPVLVFRMTDPRGRESIHLRHLRSQK